MYKILIFIILCFWKFGFSQIPNERSLIIGKVDGGRIERLLVSNYYPFLRAKNNIRIKVIKNSPTEIILSYYPSFSNSPQKIIFHFFDSELQLMAAIITDEIDFARSESAQLANEIHKSNPGIRILFKYKPANYVKMIAYNIRRSLFKNNKIRRALSYAINKQYIVRKILNNQASITSAPVDKKSKLYVNKFKEYKYNPRKALNLLKEEGWIDVNKDGILEKNGVPFKFTLIYEKGLLLDENIVRTVKLDWNKIGIDVAILPLSKQKLEQRLNSHRFDAVLTSYQFDESIESFEQLFGTRSPGNYLSYSNWRVNRFLSLAKKADPATKRSLLQGIINVIVMEQPATFLFFPWLDWYFINANKFENFLINDSEIRPFYEWKFKQ